MQSYRNAGKCIENGSASCLLHVHRTIDGTRCTAKRQVSYFVVHEQRWAEGQCGLAR